MIKRYETLMLVVLGIYLGAASVMGVDHYAHTQYAPVAVTVPAPCDVLATKPVTYPDYHTKGAILYCKDGTEFDVVVYQSGLDLCSGVYKDLEMYNHCEAQPPTEWFK